MYFGPTGIGCIEYLRVIHTTYQAPSKDPSQTSSKTAPAVPLLNEVQSEQLADGSVVGLNPAEWLVDLFTQADREGRGGDFADAYDTSQLKQVPPATVATGYAVCKITLHSGVVLSNCFQAGPAELAVPGQGRRRDCKVMDGV